MTRKLHEFDYSLDDEEQALLEAVEKEGIKSAGTARWPALSNPYFFRVAQIRRGKEVKEPFALPTVLQGNTVSCGPAGITHPYI